MLSSGWSKPLPVRDRNLTIEGGTIYLPPSQMAGVHEYDMLEVLSKIRSTSVKPR